MRIRKGKIGIVVLFMIGFILVLGINGNNSVNAATKFQVINGKGKITKYSFSQSPNNKDIVIENMNTGKVINRIIPKHGGQIGYTYVTDGSIVYYSENNWNEMCGYLFKFSISTGKTELLKKVSDEITVNYYYSGVLYILRGEFEPDFCSYDIKTEKIRKISPCSAGVIKQYGKYLCIETASGDYNPLPIYIYDTKSGKKKILKDTISATYTKDKIYYAVIDEKAFKWDSNNNVNIWRYDILKNKKKLLVKHLNAYVIGKCTDSYVYYSTWNSENRDSFPCYKYYFETKKVKKVKELKY